MVTVKSPTLKDVLIVDIVFLVLTFLTWLADKMGWTPKNQYKMTTILLIITGLLCFWLFFKAIDLFEKI